jgi:hypothetical protein
MEETHGSATHYTGHNGRLASFSLNPHQNPVIATTSRPPVWRAHSRWLHQARRGVAVQMRGPEEGGHVAQAGSAGGSARRSTSAPRSRWRRAPSRRVATIARNPDGTWSRRQTTPTLLETQFVTRSAARAATGGVATLAAGGHTERGSNGTPIRYRRNVTAPSRVATATRPSCATPTAATGSVAYHLAVPNTGNESPNFNDAGNAQSSTRAQRSRRWSAFSWCRGSSMEK